MGNIFPFVQLKSFENGWRYSGKLKEFIKQRYYSSLVKIDDSKIKDISVFLKGTVLSSRIFKNFAWVLFLTPVPKLQIYVLCERNSKTGDNFTLFFGKESCLIPTEDIYGFAVIYLTLLALIGNDDGIIYNSVDLNEFVKLNTKRKEFRGLIERKCKSAKFNIKNIVNYLDSFQMIKDYKFSRDNVEFVVEPLGNIKIKFLYNREKNEIFISKESVKIYPANLILGFAGLICNALIREFGKQEE